MIDIIKQKVERYHDEVVAIRRQIHRNPELAFEEHETAALVAQKLTEWGIAHQSGVAQTGVVALIKGNKPNTKTIALRADMDALPIQEVEGRSYGSCKSGLMHACGHDAHTASLLGAARILHELRNEFDGQIKLIFQPSEEKLPGGASVMIEEGVLEAPAVEHMLGQHVYPELPAGKVGFCGGQYMASADEIYLTVKGKGGHAALPHLLVDPVIISAQLLVALQQLVSRYTNPLEPVVLSFGKVIAQGATNVIPNEVHIDGTLRAMNEDHRMELFNAIERVCQHTAQAFGGDCDVNIVKGYPFLYNDEGLTAKSVERAKDFLGAENVVMLPPRMGAEDFAYYSQKVPACFYRFGVRNEEKGIVHGLHTPGFDIEETALKTSVGLMTYQAIMGLHDNKEN